MVEAAIQDRTLFPVADDPVVERHAFAAYRQGAMDRPRLREALRRLREGQI
jgi:hypothetical protein